MRLQVLGCKNIQGFLHMSSIKAMVGSIDHLWTSHSVILEKFCMSSQRGPRRSHPNMIRAVWNLLKRKQKESSYTA